MTRVISSRPWEREGKLALEDLSFEELQLIGSFLWVTRLGHGSPYRAAALSLMEKIETAFDEDFLQQAANDVNLHVLVNDQHGHQVGYVPFSQVEFDV